MSINIAPKSKTFIRYLLVTVILLNLYACKIITSDKLQSKIPIEDFDIKNIGVAPNYSNDKYWAAIPDKIFPYQFLPKNYKDSMYKSNCLIDVFFIHPTIYLKGDRWNADVDDAKLNKRVVNSAIKYQASVFNGIANIYAPHYRQMHIHCYSDLKNGYQAYDIAYSDVKNAFMYYWNTYNKSKKFIVAGHSQGTNHAERLLKEIILKNDTMRNLLIMSYMPGMPIKQFHKKFPPCVSETDINCFLSWRTLAEDFFPSDWEINDSISCINPITWNNKKTPSPKEKHLGILFKNNNIYYPNSISAYNHNGVVWIKPIKIPFATFYKMNNYHIADYNLFWLNIRTNLRHRLNHNKL